MNNPITLIMWLNVNTLYQSLRFSKTMLDTFFPRALPTVDLAVPAAAASVRPGRGRCLGAADLRGCTLHDSG